ncbi:MULTISPECIES: RodZ domain-containing protein [unclassified Paenibacillus]|uniref:helix-turn-helix domain-containing protein n=1 Tax=unclassified Paenibacillus TaxID=185978 RepID=UPI0009566B34|nr:MULTISPECIES: RodZ domain-containing protein [unclassified Paenibacillus]ASS65651.1 helix-turn-helix domain-containing protein [Paenibacillus sp. RUD330]SIQ28415.1 protein RodZ, contains Xre-like HTH and DUF4115 domains [Paenibacillus sp. RU4X]SIQ50634.1 protein RodZ, contains Xre-like HTH and DUF4115 domains [Paenibacillus sp. RU4T]
MSELGQTLRTAREEMGLSLDQVQEMTKIRKHYLTAIEEGNYAALPGSFYARAFVKNYAEAVGLNADELLNYYKNELPAAPAASAVEPAAAPQPPRKASTSRATSERVGKLGFSVLMWAFLALIVVLIWIFVIKPDRQTPTADETPITTNTPGPGQSPSPGDAAGGASPTPSLTPSPTPTPTPEGAVTFDRKSGKIDYYKTNGAVTIELSFTGTAWIEVRKGGPKGEFLYNKAAEAGDTLSVPVDDVIYLNTGRADNTEITVGGQLIDDGDRPSSKKIQFEPASGADASSGSGDADSAGTADGASGSDSENSH